MSLHPATVLKCNGKDCHRRIVMDAGQPVERTNGGHRALAPGWSRWPGGLHYCPECTADPDRREGKRPQYRGPKPSETPQRVDGGSPLRSGDSVPASARGVSSF